MTKTALGASNVQKANTGRWTWFIMIVLVSLTLNLKASAKEKNGGNPARISYADTTIRGRVVDSLNNPLVGVSVVVKGTSNGTTTNTAGDFTLNNVPANATLVITTVGY